MKLRNLILLIFMAIISEGATGAASAPESQPDFAHPRTVLNNAYSALEKSEGDAAKGPEHVRAVLEICTAAESIDPDSIFPLIDKVSAIVDKEINPTAKALMQLVDALMLKTAYDRRRWVYDRLETPNEPVPADIREWNGVQFRSRIDALATEALEGARAHNAPLAEYSAAIEADKRTLLYFPEVADFVAYEVRQLYNSVSQTEKAKQLTAEMQAASAPGSAPYYFWLSASISAMPWDKQFDAYLEAYKNAEHDEYARMLLLEACDNRRGDATDRSLIALLEKSLEMFPGYWDNNDVRNKLAMFRQPRNKVHYPTLACPGRQFDVTVDAEFAKSAGFDIYALPAGTTNHSTIKFAGLNRVISKRYSDPDSLEKIIRTCPVTLNAPGLYVVGSSVDSRAEKSIWGTYNAIICTPYIPVLLGGCDENIIVMTEYADGKPVEGVRILAKRRQKATVPVGTSDKDGLTRFRLAARDHYEFIAVTPDGQRLDFGGEIGQYFGLTSMVEEAVDADDVPINLSVLPDRPIYHFGDELQWAVIADRYTDDFRNRRVCEGKELSVVLHDANDNAVDTLDVKTDRFGRAFGSFHLPADGLSGYFSIRVSSADKITSRARVMVSDYRMPTFEITDLATVRDAPARGDVSLSGRAVTYSGMPVADAEVEITVSQAWRWRRWQSGARLGSLSVKTDTEGRFTAIIKAAMLDEADSHDFSAHICVTATTGENATATKAFTNGRPYLINISADGGSFLEALTKTILPVKAFDAEGAECDIPLRWTLSNESDNNVVAKGKCSSAKPIADLDRVRGGKYLLRVEAADSTMAETATAEFLIYNAALQSLPEGYPLLVPDTQVDTDTDGRAAIRYGVAADNTWVYAALCVGEKIEKMDVQKRSKGFNHLIVDLPAGFNRGRLQVFSVHEGEVRSFSVEIKRKTNHNLKITGESFRDKLVPGSSEKWNLRITDSNGTPVEAAMVAGMYNHALDALAALQWPTSFGVPEIWPQLNISYLNAGIRTGFISQNPKYLDTEVLAMPSFRFLPGRGYGFYKLNSGIRIRGTQKMSMAVSEDCEEEAVLEEALVESAAPMAMKSMDLAAAVTAGADNGAEGKAEESTVPKVDYRDAEVAQAFWMPELSSAPDGSLDISFVVPNANTTWHLQALAWTRDMKAGQLVRDIVANKPVMVQPNMPRFLRAGDTARVPATVFNNNDADAEILTVVEIFDPGTQDIIATTESRDTIAAGASAVVEIEIVAPEDANSIGYRVRSASADFADGEQSVIPVESAQCDVVESQTFYLNPGDKELKIKLPDDASGSYTLLYCQNPSWSIVKALPGLVEYEPTTSTGAVHALFAACTARGIVERTPAVADALRAWQQKPLSSRLAMNDDVKIATLQATPWVQAAQSDSARMARLALLLDATETEARIRQAVKVLSDLAAADGGIRWGKWCTESSLWATQQALHDIGLLRLASYVPVNPKLEEIMLRALAYMDRELQRLDKENKAAPDMSYAVIRSLWNTVAPSAWGKRVVNSTLNYCAANWRTASTSGKANMAILLSIYQRTADAKAVIGSLNEFAVATPAQGVSFPSVSNIEQYAPMLIAYGRIDPTSSLIDGMRQWLVVREQATVGLGAFDASQLVGAFLASGTPWHTDNAPASVKLGNRTLDLGDACSYGGEATVRLGSGAAGKTLRVMPGARVPSFGAVISNYRSRPADVKASACDAISIEKRIVRVTTDGSNEFADSVARGQHVRVLLTLHVERDMQYVTIIDERAAALEPMVQTPGMVESAGAYFYRENRDASTRMFISWLPKGTYQLTYDCIANTAGHFAAGLATVQSALAPSLTAHSAGAELTVK
ncbi:MAG: hypothetical protein K2M12_05765 [Muribaculaceae bacterium]|nr:hypothetical protein [Muribaculaceae bacterium]